ncbi:MAG: GYD domain-containing protein [Candidatus Thiodiazotropha endolucinida]
MLKKREGHRSRTISRRSSKQYSSTEENEIMSTHITLVNFTDQGIRNVKESPDRYEAFKVLAEQMGLTVVAVYYTVGHYDMVVILEGSDEAATAALLKVGSLGNIRTESMRAYSVEGMRKLVENL